MAMTHDEITEKWDGMTPRERDAWVAEVVFGEKTFGNFHEVNGVRVLIPNYTTDISAAWTVFESHPYVEVARIPGKVTVYGVRINNSNDGTVRAMTQKSTFSEAISLAALIAKLSKSSV